MSKTIEKTALVWFRRDLRAHDHAALAHALAAFGRVYCAFIFDREILDGLETRADRRVEFILRSVEALDAALRSLGEGAGVAHAGLLVRHGFATEEIPRLAVDLGAQAVLCNRDYEPAALERDGRVAAALLRQGIAFGDFKDQVIFERDEVLSGSGQPYSVFTPYAKAWLKRLGDDDLRPHALAARAARLAPLPAGERLPALDELGFTATNLGALDLPAGVEGGRRLLGDFLARIGAYQEARDFPARRGVSYLSVHLRFGTVSIRELVAAARAHDSAGARCWLNELIWREFYQMILWHHPHVLTRSFRPQYDAVRWDEAPALLEAWQEGRTGYPLVDAGMRQLAQSGYMHNRLRMVTASFLCKDLGLDWRLGERHFARLLNDYDLAANNGGWQWAASTGCDAQPWFRIFNPLTQSQRFDPEGRFIRRYLPELAAVPARHIHAPWLMDAGAQAAAGVRIGRDYPAPVVDHAQARQRTLARYGVVKGAD